MGCLPTPSIRRPSVVCPGVTDISKTKQERPIVIMEVGTADSVAAFRRSPEEILVSDKNIYKS